MSSPGQPTLGRYALVREIARSNDIVWEGRDPQMNRRVAVKELSLPASLAGQGRRDRIERFYREARAAGAMAHPNIVTIHEVGEDRGRYFIAMEYLEGQTLRERMNVGGPMPLSEAVAVTVALCDALEYAHERGIVHRDIKPDNIHLLPGGRVKLTDFGIARITHEDQLTVAGQVFGTPSYMSPEQVVGRAIDARSDLFSLGILLYEMVAGRKPFTGDSVATITYQIVNGATPQMTGVSPAIEAVINRAMAKNPADRFASAAEFRSALLSAAARRAGSQPAMPAPAYTPSPMLTAQYGQQTQWGMAPPPPVAAPPVYQPPVPAPFVPATPQSNTGRVAATAAIAVLLVGGVLWGAGVAVTRAFHQSQLQQGQAGEAQQLKEAIDLYNAGQYEPAIQKAMQVKVTARDPQTLAQAVKCEVYSYLKLGESAAAQHNLPVARLWYDKANLLLPADTSVEQHLAALKQLETAATSTTVYPAPTTGTPATTPIATPMSTPALTAPAATPSLTGAQFNAQNQRDAQDAQTLLGQATEAERRGKPDEAIKIYQQIVSEPRFSGTAATAQALARLPKLQGMDSGGTN